MTEAILIVVQSVSALVIGIILAVLCNTMAMSVRERGREYATLRALGFGPVRIVGLILGQSLAIALLGGVLGVLFCYPAAAVSAAEVGTLFPVSYTRKVPDSRPKTRVVDNALVQQYSRF